MTKQEYDELLLSDDTLFRTIAASLLYTASPYQVVCFMDDDNNMVDIEDIEDEDHLKELVKTHTPIPF